MNWLDRMIGFLSPRRALSRSRMRLAVDSLEKYREMLGAYYAGDKTRPLKDWPTTPYSADQAIIGQENEINARARAMVRNDWAAASIVRGYRRHVIGTGITSKSTARNPITGEALLDFRRRADAIFEEWANDPLACDMEQRKTLLSMQHVVASELMTVGEAIIVRNYRRDKTRVGVCLQFIEPEMLDRSMDNGEDIRGGIRIDEYGAPLEYYVHTKGHPLEVGRIESEAIPADRVWHIFRQERPRQTRGVSQLAPALRTLWHMSMYKDYTLLKARAEACIGPVVEVQAAGAFPDPANFGLLSTTNSSTDSAGNPQYEFQPLQVLRLNSGDSVKFPPPNNPSAIYESYCRQAVQEAAAGAGLDYQIVSRDFSNTNYSGQRQALLETYAEIDPDQMLIIDMWLRSLRNFVITTAILEGRLDAPDFEDREWHAAYLSHTWQPQPKPWIDPLKESQAMAMRLAYKMTTRQREMNTIGHDFEETMRQYADELNLAESLGISLPDSAPIGVDDNASAESQ